MLLRCADIMWRALKALKCRSHSADKSGIQYIRLAMSDSRGNFSELKNWWVMGQHLVTHDPCDPSDFRDPFDPWPMTHRSIPCSERSTRIAYSKLLHDDNSIVTWSVCHSQWRLRLAGWSHAQCPDATAVAPPPDAMRKRSPSSLSLIHIWRCRRSTLCRSRWSPYH